MTKITSIEKEAIFPIGEPVKNEYFVGTAYLEMLLTDSALNAPIGNVTFEPGARNNWHTHAAGQILLVTAGKGWYQEEGKPGQLLKAGDVVNIPAGVKHWHGAVKDSWFVHLALTPGETTWLEPVSEEDYQQL
ncbi:cupin domain-containing protein [Peribacillus simplex]|uniref:Cupin domain-containing protein n=1 Tax=Peribacillus simplex TaxID=1478 RepID=A0A8B5Y448_9BACI|nr:cupin domain-containing protein [Peribacillus simplex]